MSDRMGNNEYIIAQKEFSNVDIKSVIFTCQPPPPLELFCLTRSTKRDAINILQNWVAKMHILSICKKL